MPIIGSVNILKILHIFHLVVVFGSKTISLFSSLTVAFFFFRLRLSVIFLYCAMYLLDFSPVPLYALFVVRTSIHLEVDAGLKSLL